MNVGVVSNFIPLYCVVKFVCLVVNLNRIAEAEEPAVPGGPGVPEAPASPLVPASPF